MRGAEINFKIKTLTTMFSIQHISICGTNTISRTESQIKGLY